MRSFIVFALFTFLTASAALAEPMPESEIPVRMESWHIAYEVKSDGSYIETQRWSKKILKQQSLEAAKSASVTFSTSVAKGEILEAYTIKKSGQRIEAPKNSYQVTVNNGYKNSSPLYSDETSVTVMFPDLEVGDSAVFSSRVTNSEGMFPNQFSIYHDFSRFVAYDDVSVEITAPATMNLKYKNYFLTEAKPLSIEGKQKLRWTFSNKSPEKWTPADAGITVLGDSPSLYVSTFKGYKEITEAYGMRATPKAAVTDRVKQLASEIVAGKTAPEAQAHALYDWVAKNISYGGNCIGIGAVVPRDLDVVLDNKLGDCKDHSTLLQSLLAARKIESEQALINAESLYQLPDVPVVAAINHVINFIPSLNLFLDSTASYVPYGMIPPALSEKPVLLVSHYREGAKIPSSAQYGHGQTMRTTVHINANGSATGKTEIGMKGIPAIAMRSVMRLVPEGQDDLIAKKLLEGQGVHGTAVMQKDDPALLLDTYKLSVTFNLDEFVSVETASGIAVKPIITSLFPIEGFTREAYDPTPKKPYLCNGGNSSEEYVLEFPATLKIVGIPKDYELATAIIDYKATYKKSANTLTVRRELKNKTATNVCSAEYAANYKKVLLGIAKDLKSQVILSESQ
jgi:transglutaminase-like putative cysteine protease